VPSPEPKPAAKEVSFPKQKVEFDLLPGWKVVEKEAKEDRAWCVLKKEEDGTVRGQVGIWAGEPFVTEAIAKGAVIALEGKKPAPNSPQESWVGAAGANQKVMSLVLGGDYQPGPITIKVEDVGGKGLVPAVLTRAGALTGIGVCFNVPASAGGPLLVGWAFDEASKEDTTQLVKRIFEMRNTAK
jgi:hypothetical protein